jgi:hypothetical protein
MQAVSTVMNWGCNELGLLHDNLAVAIVPHTMSVHTKVGMESHHSEDLAGVKVTGMGRNGME